MALFNRNTDKQIELTVSNRTFLRLLALVLVFIAFLAALRLMGHAILLIFIAFFLALALNAPVHWVDEHLPGKRHRTRSLATVVSTLIVLIVFVGFLLAVIPPIVKQSGHFISAIPGYVNQIQNNNSTFNQFIAHYHLQSQVDTFTSHLKGQLQSVGSGAVSTLSNIGSALVSGLTILVLTFMMLVEGPHWARVLNHILPNRHRSHVGKVAADMYQVIRGYVNGQVLLALLASVFIVPALFILHISYPLALVFVVFVCGLIPLIGHTIGAIIVTAVALFQSPITAAIILAYYIFYQQVENYLIQPRLQANTTNMSPLLVFIAVVLGVGMGGLLGALIAIPAMGCVKVLVLDVLERRNVIAPKVAEAAKKKT